jgi:hypothetical protein
MEAHKFSTFLVRPSTWRQAFFTQLFHVFVGLDSLLWLFHPISRLKMLVKGPLRYGIALILRKGQRRDKSQRELMCQNLIRERGYGRLSTAQYI